MDLESEENVEKDEFLEECLNDPTLRDQMSILTRKFRNKSQVYMTLQGIKEQNKHGIHVPFPLHFLCCQWNLDLIKCQGTREIGLLYPGSVPYI